MKGLLLNITGDGKGKSTSCFGMAVRALGWGRRVALLQFIKGERETGEKHFFESLRSDLLHYETFGNGLTWTPGDHVTPAREAWAGALDFLSGKCPVDVLILDELNIALALEFLDLDEVLSALSHRPEGLHVVISGRNAPERLLDASDLVSRIDSVRHPFDCGLPAVKGIDF